MCKFCDNLDWRNYKVSYRNNSSDDNMCEYVSPEVMIDGERIGSDCSHCDGCKRENILFSLHTYSNRIGINFYRKIKGLTIDQHSEMFTFNFCPWCGKQLTEELVDFEKCGLKEIQNAT